MHTNPKRLGEALVEEQFISHHQLEEVLSIQKEQPYRSFGDIVFTLFNIPRESIEAVFINKSLIPALVNVMIDNLKKEENKFTMAVPVKVSDLDYHIDIDRIHLKRTTSKSFIKDKGDKFVIDPDYSETSTDIDGLMRITITTHEGETVFEEEHLRFIYEFEKRRAELIGHCIDSIRFHFSRKNKEILGVALGCSPITENELLDVLSQY